MKFLPLANTFFLRRFADEGCRCWTWRRGYQVYAVQFPADQLNRICWAWIPFSQVPRRLPRVEIARNDPIFSDFYQTPNYEFVIMQEIGTNAVAKNSTCSTWDAANMSNGISAKLVNVHITQATKMPSTKVNTNLTWPPNKLAGYKEKSLRKMYVHTHSVFENNFTWNYT